MTEERRSRVQGHQDCLVVHPGVQHSGSLAKALLDRQRLAALITRAQFGDRPPPLWRLPQLESRLRRRQVAGLPDCYIKRVLPAVELGLRTRSAARQHPLDGQLRSWMDRRFAEVALRSINDNINHVIGTDWNALSLFDSMSMVMPGIQRVLDVSHPPFAVVQDLIAEDAESLGLPMDTYDDYVDPASHSDRRALQEAEFASATRCVVASTFTRDCVTRTGAPAGPLAVVPYGIDRQPSTVADSPFDGKRLLFVGALSERKGVSVLLDAVGALARDGFRLDLVGNECAAYRLPARLPENVTWHRNLDNTALRLLMRRAGIFVLPSMCEGFGRVLLESLEAGCAVLTTERGGGPDIKAACPTAPIHLVRHANRRDLPAHILHSQLTEEATGNTAARARLAASRFSSARYADGISATLTTS